MLATLTGAAGTFHNARSEPIHRWFPWIEGFSDELPRLAIQSERSRSVYDPFLGSGTTALVALQMGLRTGGAEVNPFLRFLTRVKTVIAPRLAMESPAAVEKRFQQLIERAELSEPDPRLLGALFADADYFEQVALADITRVKSAIESSPRALDRDFALLALARVLVDSSNMIRRTDLRRRRENETNGQGKKVLPRFRSTLEMMVEDLGTAHFGSAKMEGVVGDARGKPGKGDPTYDLCVTSPPYLNGTNYVRNTKIEMWVLDLISSSNDLRGLRDQAVTAGINNVRLSVKPKSSSDSQMAAVLSALDERAYDRRIPALVAGYFADMSEVFQATSMRLKPGSPIYLDIGDSSFAGVHVPTDEILVSIARAVGLELRESQKIRDRRSKDGTPLVQRLLVFETPRPRRKRRTLDTPRLRLRNLVQNRPFGAPPYAARNWGHPWHSMCSYQGKLKPSIAHFLVREFSKPGDLVLDPFSGAGTIPLEACLQGRAGWGNDISPLAVRLTQAKVTRPDPVAVEKRREELLDWVEATSHDAELDSISDWGMNRTLGEYFDPATLSEVIAARAWLSNAPLDASTSILWAAVSHLLHGNRPYALSRQSHPITPFAPTGPSEYRPLRPRLVDKVDRLLRADLGGDWRDGLTTTYDATQGLGSGRRADVVLTSPPFFDSTRFHVSNWMRLWFCGWEPEHFEHERKRFLEYRQMRDFSVYEEVLSSVHRRLTTNGLAVWHLGKSSRFDMASELRSISEPWFSFEGVFDEDVSERQSHGVSAQGNTHTHQFLLLRAR
jgi:hypothetical protein